MMTKEKWIDLRGKGQWDIMVSLRGPDAYHSDNVKWLTTGVIRGAMQGIIRVGGLINQYGCEFVVVPDHGIKQYQPQGLYPHPQLSWDGSHFFQHVTESAQWLGLKVIYVNSETWLAAMGEHNLASMVEKLISAPGLEEENKQLLMKHHKDLTRGHLSFSGE